MRRIERRLQDLEAIFAKQEAERPASLNVEAALRELESLVSFGNDAAVQHMLEHLSYDVLTAMPTKNLGLVN